MSDDLTIRDAALADAPRLLEIYAYYVEKTAISFEVTVPTLAEFAGRMRSIMARYPYLVAERDGQVVGYAYAHAFVGREAYDWSVETTIYVDRELRHAGIGGRLYAALEEALRAMGVLNLNACIGVPRDGSEGDEYLTRNSEQFHARLGYALVGTFHASGYKFGRWYDMVWMEKMLGEHPDDVAPVRPYPQVRGLAAGAGLPARQVAGSFTIASFPALANDELFEIARARMDVFVGEQHILDPELDDVDKEAWHVFSWDGKGQVGSYLRMFVKPDEPRVMQAGRVLTRQEARGQGLGMKLLLAAEKAVRQAGCFDAIYLESQKHAQGFYEKAGYVACSDDFMEAGIVHVQMRKAL